MGGRGGGGRERGKRVIGGVAGIYNVRAQHTAEGRLSHKCSCLCEHAQNIEFYKLVGKARDRCATGLWEKQERCTTRTAFEFVRSSTIAFCSIGRNNSLNKLESIARSDDTKVLAKAVKLHVLS